MTSALRSNPEAAVRAIYRKLSRAWGPQHWWPAETPFEVIVGAILTQNTSWKNVERAMATLRAAGRLSIQGVRELEIADLEQLIRSSGYYRQKADRLKRFVAFLDESYGGSLEKMFATPTVELRAQLLSLKGVGRETADAILLYAGNHKIFVVDAYTRRILQRHGAIDADAGYEEIRSLVEGALRREKVGEGQATGIDLPRAVVSHQPSNMSRAGRSARSQIYNEMHGLFVQVGKHYCEKLEARCHACPLRALLPHSGPRI